MMRFNLTILLGVFLVSSAAAETSPPAYHPWARPKDATVTISPRGYAQIDVNYEFFLRGGESNVVELTKLPTGLVPTSIFADRFDGQIGLGPVTFRDANLSPGAVERRLLNREVTFLVPSSTEPGKLDEVTGMLLSFDGSTALIKDKDNYIRKVVQVVSWKCKQLPDGLNNTPTLNITLDTGRSGLTGSYNGNIRYRTRGIGYSTSHLWIYNEGKDEDTLTWHTDVLVHNASGADFENARLNLVAGDTGGDRADMEDGRAGMNAAAAPAMAPTAGMRAPIVRQAEVEDLSGIQVFSVTTPVTLHTGEDQKVPFYRSQKPVKIRRTNHVRASAWYPNRYTRGGKLIDKVATIVTFKNDGASNLGTPIPAGPVSVQQRGSNGILMPIGGTRLGDLAVGEEVSSEIGSDFNLKAARRVLSFTKGKPRTIAPPKDQPTHSEDGKFRYEWYQYTNTWLVETELHNGKNKPVEFTVDEFADDEHKFVGSHPFALLPDGSWQAKVSVGAVQDCKLTYTIARVYTDYNRVPVPIVTPPKVKDTTPAE